MAACIRLPTALHDYSFLLQTSREGVSGSSRPVEAGLGTPLPLLSERGSTHCPQRFSVSPNTPPSSYQTDPTQMPVSPRHRGGIRLGKQWKKPVLKLTLESPKCLEGNLISISNFGAFYSEEKSSPPLHDRHT